MEKYEILDALFSAQRQLPTLPVIFVEFNNLIANPMVSPRKVANLIMKDQAMVVKILRLSNSALYGKIAETTDLSAAISYLGLETLKKIILQVALVRMFRFEDVRIPEVRPAVLWEHSIATACFAEMLARELRLPANENYYIGGLLHDIGKLPIYQFYPDKFEESVLLQISSGIANIEAEKTVLGVDHSDIGAHLAEKWKFNRELIGAIEWHHRENCVKMTRLAAVVAIANRFAHLTGLCFPWDERPSDIAQDPRWSVLNEARRTPLDVTQLIFLMNERVDDVRSSVAELLAKA